MLSTLNVSFEVILISLVYFSHSVAAQDSNTIITVPLNNTITNDNREIYGRFLTLNSSTTVQVNFNNVNKSLSFIVFQVHSHLHNVTLYKNVKLADSEVTGTNVGLVSLVQVSKAGALDTFFIENPNENITLRVYVSAHGYGENDPIPGGCNMEFNVPISPFLRVQTKMDYILVDAAPASIDIGCATPNVANLTYYMMYLPEMNFYADAYFDGIRKMMSWKTIKQYGTEVPKSSWPSTRRMLSAYPGTGAIYTVVASVTTPNIPKTTYYSIYVPSYSYGCSTVDEDEGCEIIVDMLSQFLCAVMLFVGVFVCFFGHRFFKTEMFLAGFLGGFIISYILIALMAVDIDRPALLAAGTLSGMFFGAIWLLFWWLYGIPVVAVLLPSLNLGFLLAAIFYYRLPGHVIYLEEDFNFWSPFVLVMMLTALAVVSVTFAANILCCAVLGAYATVLPIDYYLGSNLKYIIINTIRRAVVPNFGKAVLLPPDQWRDISVALIWTAMATLGFLFQHWYHKGRPPFPPPPRNVRPSMPEPLMYGSIIDYRARLERERERNASRPPRQVNSERTPLLS